MHSILKHTAIMTREAQIKQAAIERGCIEGTAEYYGFIQGARYADQNPTNPWHKASEEIPPICEPCDESADCVLAVLGRQVKIGGKIYLTGFYDHQIRDWHIYGNGYSKMTNLEVIDWMLLNKSQS